MLRRPPRRRPCLEGSPNAVTVFRPNPRRFRALGVADDHALAHCVVQSIGAVLESMGARKHVRGHGVKNSGDDDFIRHRRA